MQAERETGVVFECKWCGETLVSGDAAWSNAHFINSHVIDYINELERAGVGELDAHRAVNRLVESIGTPAR